MITTAYDEPQKTLTFSLDTDLLSSNAERAQACFERALANPQPFAHLYVDLCRCKMVDSVGLNLLFGLLHRAQELGAKPTVRVCKGALEHVMRVARVDKLFGVEVVMPAVAKETRNNP